MNIRVKLYASLGAYLPDGAVRNEVEYTAAEGASIAQVLSDLSVPGEMCHLVMIDGIYVAPGERDSYLLKDGHHLAVWPPVAGG